MQMKTTKMTIIKLLENNKCWQEYVRIRILLIADGNVKWSHQYGKQYGSFSKNYIGLAYDPANPFLGIYPK